MCSFTMKGGLIKLILNMQSRQICVPECLYYFSAEWTAWKYTGIPSLGDYRFHLHKCSQSQLHTSLLACVKWRWANFSLVKGVYCQTVCHSVLQLMHKTINSHLKQRVMILCVFSFVYTMLYPYRCLKLNDNYISPIFALTQIQN